MKMNSVLSSEDQELLARLDDFIPQSIFDIHSHLFDPKHFVKDNLVSLLRDQDELGLQSYLETFRHRMPRRIVEGLFFGFPSRGNDRFGINQWIADQIRCSGADHQALALVSPKDSPEKMREQISHLGMVGIKPYHLYASDSNTSEASIEDFAPEWMWEICDSMQGVMMLHIMKGRAIADAANQRTLRRLCHQYPNCRVVLAHVARSFNYRYARKGLEALVDLDNVSLDTSAITETETFRKAIDLLGPERLLYGSDYPVSEARGRCVAIGESFFWAYPGEMMAPKNILPPTDGTLIGIESLLCLQEACEDSGLNQRDIQNVFRNNALRMLAPHLKKAPPPSMPDGPELWSNAWKSISGGTSLLSKRAELHDPKTWPSYFSKCLGSSVWDTQGNRYIDFTGGVGAVLLGYADPDVTAAVRRQLSRGTHCSLCTPDEVELADLLLELHPWAGRVRYARGGGEALAVAVRIARAATGKSGIAFCGYHGWQDWYLAANLGDDSSLDGHLLPGLQPAGVPRELKGTSVPFKFNDFASFEDALRALDGKLAGVVMEPMRSQNPQNGFLQKVAAKCRESGAVFMVDEVTGGWRFGYPGAMNLLGIEPDIAVYAKAMSNGFPCAAIVGKREIMDAANPSFISSTYWTDGVGPAAALASIRKMRTTDAQKRVSHLGGILKQRLEMLSLKYPALRFRVEGQPSAPQITFDLGNHSQAAKQILVRRMLAKGFLVWATWYVMLTHTQNQVDAAMEALDPVLKEIEVLFTTGLLQQEAGPRGGIRDAMGMSFTRLA